MDLNRQSRVIRAAGILDGEGTFRTKSNGHVPIIACEMTDLDIIEELCDLFGGTITKPKLRNEKYKQTWVWGISSSKASDIMLEIRPFVFSRRKTQIDKILHTWENRLKVLNTQKANRILAAEEYLLGKTSLRKVAEKYNVSYETVRRTVEELKKL